MPMHVISVIPLIKASGIDTLTYYSAQEFPIGTIIDVPIRKQTKRAVVVGTEPLSATKTAIRTATFSLKKLPEQPNPSSLPATLIETAQRLTKTTPATLGAVLFSILPPEVREGTAELSGNLPCLNTAEAPLTSVLQDVQSERFRTYRSFVREMFAHRGSVVLVVPSSADIDTVVESMRDGIEDRVVVFSSTFTPKRIAKSYEAANNLSHTKLIITTPAYCCIDRHDITAVIVEQSGSQFYKGKTRPYLDTREVVQTLAKVAGRTVLLGDIMPRSEDEHKRREDFYISTDDAPKRLSLPAKLITINQTPDASKGETFTLISPEVTQAITETHAERGNIFILAARRGLAPVVNCIDCGHIFRCPDSGEPYSLHRTGSGETEKRWFIASSTGRRIVAPDTCPDCGSWRLRERGIGIQHLHDVLRTDFPDIPVILFDHTTASTPRKAQRLISDFYEHKGAILLGTSMVLPYITKPVTTTIISSHEATRSAPTWRADETYFSLLLRLREKTSAHLYIQMRDTEDDVVSTASRALVEDFYTDELELREQLKYPPFFHFIHLTIQGEKAKTKHFEEQITNHLEAYDIRWYSAPQFISNGIRRHGLIRVATSAWPDVALMNKLRALPPSVRIEVDPERVV